MIVHSFDPVLVDFGFLQIRWYSLAYIFGIIIGWIYAKKIVQIITIRSSGAKDIKGYDFDNLIVYLVFGIILGGRLGYVLFYNLSYYSENFLEIFLLWNGGMSFHGGLVGVIISTIIFAKKRGGNFFKYTDIISCVAPIGIFLGRIANFMNAELYGKASTLPWAIIFPNAGNFARHPSQIYEAILEGLVLFGIINYLSIKKKLIFNTGYISSIFLILYSILRIISEIFREPDKHVGLFLNYFSMGTLLSLLTIIAGLFIILFIKKNEQNI